MATFDINIKKLNENATIPSYGSEFAAGADLYACMDEPVTIAAGETQFIHTGLAIEIPAGYADWSMQEAVLLANVVLHLPIK